MRYTLITILLQNDYTLITECEHFPHLELEIEIEFCTVPRTVPHVCTSNFYLRYATIKIGYYSAS